MNLTEIKIKSINELVGIATDLGIEDVGRLKKQDIIFKIFKHKASEGLDIYGGGVLEILNDGFGFLRSPEGSYCAGPDDIYVSPSQIRKFSLRKGDSVAGKIRTPKDQERYFAMVQVDTINGEEPTKTKNKILYENLTPLFPNERLLLEQGTGSNEDLSSRIKKIESIELQPISKNKLHEALKFIIDLRSINIGEKEINYLITYSKRNISDLLKTIEKLDKLSVQLKRKITIPMIKDVI